MSRAEPANPDEAAETLHHVLDRLSPRDRLVITLLHLENHTVAETAALTGWSQTMVKVQAFRARSKLRKLLERTIMNEIEFIQKLDAAPGDRRRSMSRIG